MQIPRRLLPSLPLLTAFEAAARTGSITAAAQELNLTQSAVSRQIKALEEQLGVELFLRERQTVRLTLAGDGYAREIRDALRRISSASLNLRANPIGGTLNLAVLPTFGARWLAQRLPRFLKANPGIVLNLVTRMAEFDFRLEALDAAVHFGLKQWPGVEYALLRGERVVPVCSPQVMRDFKFKRVEDLLKAPLLILASRPDAWERWLAAQNLPTACVHGMMFDQFATMAQGAVAGLGLALLPTFLIEDELRRGDLVTVLDLPYKYDERYYLVWPTERATYPPLKAFKEWLLAETAPDR